MSRNSHIHLFSWNVNGLRSCERRGFSGWLAATRPDVVGLQEVRATPGQLEPHLVAPDGYSSFFRPAGRPGYSGVALLSRIAPLAVDLSPLSEPRFDDEGRLIVADLGDFLFYTAYFPNGGHDLSRVGYKLEFSEAVLQHAEARRREGRPVVLCGDVNTSHREIDLARPKANRGNTGFLPVECAWVDRLVGHGWVDAFRHLHPGEAGHYTWWSNRKGVRERNVGWRIDYFFLTPELLPRLVACRHHPQVLGSDHCPVELVLERPGSPA